MAISLSHGGGETIYSSGSPSTEVLVGTLDGVALIERSGTSWRVAHQALQGKHIHALVFEEGSGIWFAGVRHGGIMASADGGKSWEQRDNGLTEKDVYSFSKAKLDGKARLFAGTEPACLFVSDDLGKSWTERPGLKDVPSYKDWMFPGPPHIAHLKHVNFEPGNPHTIYGSIEVGALLKSTDDGVTWQEISGVYEDVHRCIIHPKNPKHLFVTGGMGLWQSKDDGTTWENTFSPGSEYGGYPDQLVFKPSDPNYMIVSAGRKSPPTWREETAQTRISRSRDGGASWEIMGSGLKDRMPHSIEAMCLEEAGDKVQVFAGTTGGSVLWSGDGGEHWQTIIKGLAPISKGGHYRGLVGQAA
ncbi:MAG: WD40/YVTN/BNR-like repeat-containing protein [Candidatus Binatia bacterium]